MKNGWRGVSKRRWTQYSSKRDGFSGNVASSLPGTGENAEYVSTDVGGQVGMQGEAYGNSLTASVSSAIQKARATADSGWGRRQWRMEERDATMKQWSRKVGK